MSIAAIHILKKELALSEHDYREILSRCAGVDSSRELDEAGDRAVMGELYALRDYRRSASGATAPKTPQERKIWALWLGRDNEPGLSRYLPQNKRTSCYLAGIIARFGAVRYEGRSVRFDALSKSEAAKAIEALSYRLEAEKAKLADVPF